MLSSLPINLFPSECQRSRKPVTTGAGEELKPQEMTLQFQLQKDCKEPQLYCNKTQHASTLHIQLAEKKDKSSYKCIVKNPVE